MAIYIEPLRGSWCRFGWLTMDFIHGYLH